METVSTIIEMLNNILFMASAYNQIWTIKNFHTKCGKDTIAIVDERSGEEKLVFHNPDDAMKEVMKLIEKKGWFEVKQDYLNSPHFSEKRVRLCEKDCSCHK